MARPVRGQVNVRLRMSALRALPSPEPGKGCPNTVNDWLKMTQLAAMAGRCESASNFDPPRYGRKSLSDRRFLGKREGHDWAPVKFSNAQVCAPGVYNCPTYFVFIER